MKITLLRYTNKGIATKGPNGKVHDVLWYSVIKYVMAMDGMAMQYVTCTRQFSKDE
jgi:hypothetical protein